MDLTNWLLFLGVALLLTFTPGPAVLLAISNSVTVGPRHAFVCALGNAAGLFIVSAIAMAGMGAILATSALAFTVLKLGGAAYLVYLGIRQWRTSGNLLEANATKPGQSVSRRRIFGYGMTIALTNPKAILFFSALFPQFLTHDAPLMRQFLVLTTTFAICAVFSHSCYIVLARVMSRQFANPRRFRIFNRAAGAIFVVLGLSLLRLRREAA